MKGRKLGQITGQPKTEKQPTFSTESALSDQCYLAAMCSHQRIADVRYSSESFLPIFLNQTFARRLGKTVYSGR